MLGCAARPGNLRVYRAVRGGPGSSETLERCRIRSVNSGRLAASKTTLGYIRESGAQGEGPRDRIPVPFSGESSELPGRDYGDSLETRSALQHLPSLTGDRQTLRHRERANWDIRPLAAVSSGEMSVCLVNIPSNSRLHPRVSTYPLSCRRHDPLARERVGR